MLDKILLFIATIISSIKTDLSSVKTRMDAFATTIQKGTNNTTDTWVPVWTGNTIQHRVIPAMLGTKVTVGVQLANGNVMTLNEVRVMAYQLNATEYALFYHVRITCTQKRTGMAAWRFLLNNDASKPATQYTPTYIANRQAGNYNNYMAWVDNGWVIADGEWTANTTRTWQGACVVQF